MIIVEAGQEEKGGRKHGSVQSQSFPWDRSKFHLSKLQGWLATQVPWNHFHIPITYSDQAICKI